MRGLTIILLFVLIALLASCMPRSVSEGYGSYYPPSVPLDTVTADTSDCEWIETRAWGRVCR
jgi:hypothetical protein